MDTLSPRWNTTSAVLSEITAAPGAIPTTDVVLSVQGPGAVACMQGLLTVDIAKPLPPVLVHGAVLTAKGMIVTPLWCARHESELLLIVPRLGVEALRALLTRSLPPRLAKVREVATDGSVWWLVGGGVPPGTGQTLTPSGPAPFDALWIGSPDGPPTEGRVRLPEWHAEALRMLGGWAHLGAEIDERTLPQEVRFDELQSIAYDKGCYVGQETVARLHFRGHANRMLRAIIGTGVGPDTVTVTSGGGKDVGSIASWAQVGEEWLGLVKLRREVASGDTVMVGAEPALVREFPLTATLHTRA